MAKYNIDDILSDLGVPPKAKESPTKQRIDGAEDPFGPLPSMPANQGPSAAGAVPDPAIKKAPQPARPAIVGPALAEIYTPEAQEAKAQQLGDLLVTRGVINAQQLTTAQAVLKQSPGRTLTEIIIEQGADEVNIVKCVAELSGLPFERVDLEKGVEGGFDGKLLQRLTPEFCRSTWCSRSGPTARAWSSAAHGPTMCSCWTRSATA
jgi:hypothetical protein